MAYKKIKDLCVKTGEYVVNGETKPRFENIGGFFKNEEGKTFLTIKKTFNPAGVQFEMDPSKDSILVSIFDLREDGEKPQQSQAAKPAAKAAPAAAQYDDSDIPFN